MRNIFGGGGGFASRMNMFNKKSNANNEASGVISTGVSMKERLNLFSNRGIPQPKQEQQNKVEPKKIKLPTELTNKLMNNVGPGRKNSNTNPENENKKENISKENKEKEKNIENNINIKEKKDEEIKNKENIKNKNNEKEINEKKQNNENNEQQKEIIKENNKEKIEQNKEEQSENKNNDNIKVEEKEKDENNQENIKENDKDKVEENNKKEQNKENKIEEQDKEKKEEEKQNEEIKQDNEDLNKEEQQKENLEENNQKENIENENQEKIIESNKKEENTEEQNEKNEEEIKQTKEEETIDGQMPNNKGTEEQNKEEEKKELEMKKEESIPEKIEEKKNENKEEITKKENEMNTLKIENELKNKNIISPEEKTMKEKEKVTEKKETKKENILNNKRASMQIPAGGFNKLIPNIENRNLETDNKETKNIAKNLLNNDAFKRLMNEKFKNLQKRNSEIPKKKMEDKNIQKPENEEQSKKITPFQENKLVVDDLTPNQNNIPTQADENNSIKINNIMCKTDVVNYEDEMKKLNENKQKRERKNSTEFPNQRRSAQINSIEDFGFEVIDSDLNSSDDLIDGFLDSINYDKYLSDLKSQGKKEEEREAFCEGFFIASIPKIDGKVIENSVGFPASCGHDECSGLYSMKPEIIMRYPLKDTKNLELNNLAATICFPTGIKLCYSENEAPNNIEDYVTQITNQKGERYYMRTFHFYHRMNVDKFSKQYENDPIKHLLKKTTTQYSLLTEEDLDKHVEEIQNYLDFCQSYGFRDSVYIPYCLCLISKYPYIKELEICLNTIYIIMEQGQEKINFKINELIMYLIHSIPIPDKNMRVRFYIPYYSKKMELLCPKEDDVSTMNSNLTGLFTYLSIDNIVLIFRLLLSEKKILFIHDDYTSLTNVTDSFISLLYPFKWVHTYIPIMSDQMLKYLETFLPFLNGIHESLMGSVDKIFKENEAETDDGEEVFLIYINKNEITLGSTLKKEKKVNFRKYVQSNVLPLPFEKDLKKELNNIKSSYESLKRKSIIIDKIHLEKKMRDAFIDIFVKMFYDYEKYIGILDDDVVFNKVLFMNSVNKDEKFYDEFIDCQLFQQFTQNILKDGCSYFNKKIKEKKEKEEKKKDKKKEKPKSTKESKNKKDSIYLIRPDFLGIKENDKELIEKTIKEKYENKENKEKEKKNKILEDVYQIENENYVNSDCIIYLNPEKKDKDKKDEEKKIKLQELKGKTISGDILKNKASSALLTRGELTERQIDQIKEEIKDMVVQIFKSEIKESDNRALKKEAFRNLETSFGRAFFISLISNNNNNVISLQENSFNFLESLFIGILNSVLKLEETDEIIEEIVILIKVSKYFEVQSQKKEKNQKKHHHQKEHQTIYQNMKKHLQNYTKINQKNIWQKWFELDLKKKSEEEQIDDNAKVEIILNICREMTDLEIYKTSIKNYIDSFSISLFGEESEIYKSTQKQYRLIISKAPYISGIK